MPKGPDDFNNLIGDLANFYKNPGILGRSFYVFKTYSKACDSKKTNEQIIGEVLDEILADNVLQLAPHQKEELTQKIRRWIS